MLSVKASLPTFKDALRPPIVSVVGAIGFLLTSMVLPGQRHPGMDSAVYNACAGAVFLVQRLHSHGQPLAAMLVTASFVTARQRSMIIAGQSFEVSQIPSPRQSDRSGRPLADQRRQ